VESTPNEDEREHKLNEEAQAIAATNVPVDDDNFVDDVQDAQFNESNLSGFDHGLDHDWSDGFTESNCTYLEEHTKLYYSRKCSAAYHGPFSLFTQRSTFRRTAKDLPRLFWYTLRSILSNSILKTLCCCKIQTTPAGTFLLKAFQVWGKYLSSS
jgi:hypothetical protein